MVSSGSCDRRFESVTLATSLYEGEIRATNSGLGAGLQYVIKEKEGLVFTLQYAHGLKIPTLCGTAINLPEVCILANHRQLSH